MAQKNLHPTKIDKVRDKLLNLESYAYQARHCNQEDRMMRDIRLIGSIYNEIWVLLNTPESKGKEWGWWE